MCRAVAHQPMVTRSELASSTRHGRAIARVYVRRRAPRLAVPVATVQMPRQLIPCALVFRATTTALTINYVASPVVLLVAATMPVATVVVGATYNAAPVRVVGVTSIILTGTRTVTGAVKHPTAYRYAIRVYTL